MGRVAPALKMKEQRVARGLPAFHPGAGVGVHWARRMDQGTSCFPFRG